VGSLPAWNLCGPGTGCAPGSGQRVSCARYGPSETFRDSMLICEWAVASPQTSRHPETRILANSAAALSSVSSTSTALQAELNLPNHPLPPLMSAPYSNSICAVLGRLMPPDVTTPTTLSLDSVLIFELFCNTLWTLYSPLLSIAPLAASTTPARILGAV
jgi:hypothetical protein